MVFSGFSFWSVKTNRGYLGWWGSVLAKVPLWSLNHLGFNPVSFLLALKPMLYNAESAAYCDEEILSRNLHTVDT